MGSREDRLEARLAAVVPSPSRPDDPEYAGASSTGEQAASAEPHLAPLIEAASDLASFATVRPSSTFTARLGQRLLARAEQRRQEDHAFSTVKSAAESALDKHATAPSTISYLVRARTWQHTPTQGPLRRAVIAAVALVALGIGGWTAAMVYGAAPGSAFFGLHQIGQNLTLGFMDQQGRAEAHIQTARQWLADLRAAANGQGDSSTYGTTLAALRDEDAAASQAIEQIPPGTGRDAVSTELAALLADEKTTLRAALPHIGWADRIATTQALASLGEPVPQAARATVDQAHGLWQVTLLGSGFESGAVLLIDGKPAGSVTAITGTTLTAQAPSGLLKNGSVALGIGNPDGTAAMTTAIVFVAAPTATPNGHGGNGGNGGHNPHGSPTNTPGANGTGNSDSGPPNVTGNH